MAAGPNTGFTGLFINSFAGKHTVADLSTTVPPDASASSPASHAGKRAG